MGDAHASRREAATGSVISRTINRSRIVQTDGYGATSSGCKLRGGPKISRRIITSLKLDFDASNVAIFILKSAPMGTPEAFEDAEVSTEIVTICGC